MQAKTLILIMMAISAIKTSTAGYGGYGGYCDEKSILHQNNKTLKYDSFQDHYSAYNKVPSCASLHTDENKACCYMKIKYKNDWADKKYTHHGCIQVSEKEYEAGVKELTKEYESEIESKDSNLKKVKVSIDCNSNIIKLTGLVLLAFLL